MSEDDDKGAQKVAVMIVSMLVFTTALVMFSCYRICREDWIRKRQKRLAPIEIEPIRIDNIINQTSSQTADATQQSDHQLVFGSLNILSTTSSEINQETVRHCQLAELQNEYERRALERRVNFDNKESCLPPYSSKDETLPSYDQALGNRADGDNI